MEEKSLYKSKSRQNMMKSKSKTLLLKYSNLLLFEKRELQLKNKQSKKNFNIKEFLNKSKKNQNQLFSSRLQKTESIPYLLKTMNGLGMLLFEWSASTSSFCVLPALTMYKVASA